MQLYKNTLTKILNVFVNVTYISAVFNFIKNIRLLLAYKMFSYNFNKKKISRKKEFWILCSRAPSINNYVRTKNNIAIIKFRKYQSFSIFYLKIKMYLYL